MGIQELNIVAWTWPKDYSIHKQSTCHNTLQKDAGKFTRNIFSSWISLKFATFAQYYSVCLSLAWRTSFYIHFFLYCICTCGLVILIQFPDLLSLRNGRITTTNKQRKTTTKCLSSLITSCGPRLPKTYNFKVVSVMQEVWWHVAWYYNKSEQYKSVHFSTVKIVTVGKWVL